MAILAIGWAVFMSVAYKNNFFTPLLTLYPRDNYIIIECYVSLNETCFL